MWPQIINWGKTLHFFECYAARQRWSRKISVMVGQAFLWDFMFFSIFQCYDCLFHLKFGLSKFTIRPWLVFVEFDGFTAFFPHEFRWVKVQRLQTAQILSGANSHKCLQGCLCRSLFSKSEKEGVRPRSFSLKCCFGDRFTDNAAHTLQGRGKMKILVFAFTAGKQWNVLICPGHKFLHRFCEKDVCAMWTFLPICAIKGHSAGVYSLLLCLCFKHVYNTSFFII